MKTLKINGQNQKVEASFIVEQQVPLGKPFQVSIEINDKRFQDAFTGCVSFNRSTGRHSISYVCNKTGVKFGDSEKKCMEHVLSLN